MSQSTLTSAQLQANPGADIRFETVIPEVKLLSDACEAIDLVMLQAYDAGSADIVRVLHSVTGLLRASAQARTDRR